MKTIIELVTFLNENFIWGIPMVLFMFLTGIYLGFLIKWVIFIRFRTFIKQTAMTLFKKQDKSKLPKGALTPFQSLCTALAATIGTGNIVGVSLAIAFGGPGAVFWLWISALVGMVIKYSEVTLSIAFRKRNITGELVGGPMYYIENGLQQKGLAVLFAIFGTFAAFGIGASVQANAISTSTNASFNMSHILSGFVVATLAGLVLIGGIKRIAYITECLVPFMSILYVTGSAIVLFLYFKKIPSALFLIIKSAFTNTAAIGGFLGASVSKACRIGITRGVFTHEAGMGSSPIAHASAYTDHPAHQGLWGALEVFFDSIILCTITTLVILTSGVWTDSRMLLTPEIMTSIAFENAFTGGRYIVSIGLSLFAFATILAWYYYGEVCLTYLTKGKAWITKLYQIIYIVIIFIGSVISLESVWECADLLNGLMSIPNLISLLLLAPTIRKLTKEYFDSI